MLRFRAASALLPAHALIVLVGALLSWAVAANTASPSCAPFAATETARVEAVVDGDTLRLADGRRVRLIGVNAPELHDRSGHAEPGAVSARRFASRFLGGSRIMLVVGEVRHDRYGRTLAHVWRADGASLEGALLAAGLARHIALPPDLRQLECLSASERRARSAGSGLWGSGEFAPHAVSALRSGESGFRLLRGRVSALGRSRSAWWLEIEDRVALRIARADQGYFDLPALQRLRGREVEFRGWLVWRDASGRSAVAHPSWTMALRHPASLVVLD